MESTIIGEGVHFMMRDVQYNMWLPKNSILRANDPFDKNVNSPDNPNGYTFDPSYVYTTFQGVRGFFGVRYTIK